MRTLPEGDVPSGHGDEMKFMAEKFLKLEPLDVFESSRHLLRHSVLGKAEEGVGVTVLVVIPGNNLDELVVEGNPGLGIKDGSAGFVDEVGGDDVFVGVAEDTSKRAGFRSFLHLGADFSIGSRLDELDGEVNDGDISGRDTEGHTSELTVEVRDDETNGLGSTSGGRDHVVEDTAATTVVLLGGTIDDHLGRSGGVNGSHETGVDTPVVIKDLGDWGETVGGTGSVGDDLGTLFELFVIDTHDKGWDTSISRAGDDNKLDAVVDVRGAVTTGRFFTSTLEDAGAFENDIDLESVPVDGLGGALSVELDEFAVDFDAIFLSFDGTVETTVNSVVLEEVSERLWVSKGIVDTNDFNLVGSFEGKAHSKTTDTATTVDTNTNRHNSE